MNVGSTHISGRFWGLWTLASAIGFIVGGMLALPIGYGLGEVVMDATNESAGFAVAGAFFGILVGGGLGIGQQLVLRSRVEWSRMWALASAAATTVVWAIAFPLMASADEPASASTGAIIAILFGLALGVAQWLVLRKHVPGAGRWVAITLVSLALAIGLAFSLDGEGRELLAFGAAGLLAGALTGLGMAWLLPSDKTFALSAE